jgi:hypothetical protein
MTAMPEPRFTLVEQRRVCAEPGGSEDAGGLLQATVLDAAQQPMPNVELLIRWSTGEDRFYTGLKPEMGVGYADYALAEGESYQVGIVGTESDVAQGIVADACGEGGTLASWKVVFQRSGDVSP